jgi:gamma-tubulin complex component
MECVLFYGRRFQKILTDLLPRALDFLLMDYKPPPPLDVVITPEVLSKYQRIFSFILRLLRGESSNSTIRGAPI